VLRERLTAQLLAGPPAHDPVVVAGRLLAVQGQDPRGFRLAVRSRTSGLTAADVDRALSDDRSLVVTWLNRGTLHLVRSEDYAWLHALTAPAHVARVLRRLDQEGVDASGAERAVAAIERSLAAEGPLTREQLGERIARTGVRTVGQALIHLLALASLGGLTVRGPVLDGAHAYVLVHDWLGELRAIDRDIALAELARRYLSGHGPAEDRDLARWSGLGLRDARAGLAAIASELEQRADGLVDLARRPPPADLPPPRLLGAFDPVLLGWTSREPVVGEHQAAITVNGIFRPFALVEGRAAGTWTMPGGRVALKPFGLLRSADAAALEEDAADVVRFLSAG
jgi:Winged helix DNA-binding domain